MCSVLLDCPVVLFALIKTLCVPFIILTRSGPPWDQHCQGSWRNCTSLPHSHLDVMLDSNVTGSLFSSRLSKASIPYKALLQEHAHCMSWCCCPRPLSLTTSKQPREKQGQGEGRARERTNEWTNEGQSEWVRVKGKRQSLLID